MMRVVLTRAVKTRVEVCDNHRSNKSVSNKLCSVPDHEEGEIVVFRGFRGYLGGMDVVGKRGGSHLWMRCRHVGTVPDVSTCLR